MNRIFYFILAFVIISFSVQAQYTVTVSGSSPVNVGQSAVYTSQWKLNGKNTTPPVAGDWCWIIQGGTVTTSTSSQCTVIWETPGSGRVELQYYTVGGGGNYFPFKSVLVNCPVVTETAQVTGNIRFGSGSLSLQASGASANNTYKWYNPLGTLLYTGALYTTPVVASSTTNYVYVKVAMPGNCEGPAVWINIAIESLPAVASTTEYLVMNNCVLSTTLPYDSYTWKNASGTVLASTPTYTPSAPGTYTVTVSKSGLPGTSQPFVLKAQLENLNNNYILVNTPQQEVNSLTDIQALPVTAVSQAIQYFDGIGRPIQSVSTMASPDRFDIVQPVVYDGLGREHRKYLPFVAGQNGRYKPNENVIDDATGAYTGMASTYSGVDPEIAADTKPFAETRFEENPFSRPVKIGSPGLAWQPTGLDNYYSSDHTIRKAYGYNTSNEVLRWTYTAPATGTPFGSLSVTLPGGALDYYAENNLYKNRTKDEQGHEVIEFIDPLGRTVLKKVEAGPSQYASTYYIYDDLNQLVSVIPPQAVALLPAEYNSADAAGKEAFLGRWAFRYRYDRSQRMILKQVPGADSVRMVYDIRDRLVMSQDGNQRMVNQWLYTKYDALNRPVITGIYTHSTAIGQKEMSALISTINLYESYDGTPGVHDYTNTVFPTGNTQLLTTTYYDTYDFRSLITGLDYVNNDLSGQPAARTLYQGNVTGTKVNILGSTDYLHSVIYYDDRYRVLQTVGKNHKGGTDRVTNQYDFTGKVLQTKATHIMGAVTRSTRQRFEYDHAGRLLKQWHTVNSEGEILLTRNEYNELGQLITKKLHDPNGDGNVKQKTDYRYTIRGWLDNINDVDNPEMSDLFSMDLNYNDPTANGGAPQFNGNISETRWTTAGSAKQSYGYTYDAMNRLTKAQYYDQGNPLNNSRFDEWIGDTDTGVPGYDLNGNILKLYRHGKMTATPQGKLDELSYAYVGNQLKIVNDATADNTTEQGFKELTEKVFDVTNTDAQNEYAYDRNGNLKKDDNKGITAITYNHLNLPLQVNKSATEYIVYTYDAAGRKLSQQVFGTTAKTTDYLGEYIYENNVLQFINQPEGRIIPGTGGSNEYQYHLKDHLGNVRLTFTSKTSTESYTAGFETANQESEAAKFPNYPSAGGQINTQVVNANTGTNSQLLNGGYSGQVGLAKSFSVMPGDLVSIQAYAKYSAPTATATNYNNFISSLLSAFSLSAPAGGETGTAASGVNAFGNWELGETGNANQDDVVKLFVTIILFDRNYNLIDAAYEPSTASGTLMSKSYTVKEPGYAYLYISNEHPYQVNGYFDDITISHTPSPVVQMEDYYAFGLTFNSYSREKTSPNQNLYQSKEWQDELNLNMYDFEWRYYDPSIGRTTTQDPHSFLYSDFSPYSFLFDGPINFIDPTGMDGIDVKDKFDNENLSFQLGNADNVIAICPNCPNTPEFKPYIDDPDNVYDYDPKTGKVSLVPKLAEVTVTANRYEGGEIYGWDNVMRESFGGGMVYTGRNTKPVSGKTGGATPGTSRVSEYLAKKYPRNIPEKNPKLWKLLKKIVPKSVAGQPLRSPVAGRMLGRAVPILGEILLLWDAVDLSYDAIDSFINDTSEEFFEKSRENVTTVGMYQDH